MERLSINFKDTTFGPDISDECILRAVIGPDGLSFAVRRKNSGTQYLHTWVFNKEHRENALRRILNNEEIASYPFASVELMYFTPTATIVPKRMFDPVLAGDYLHTLTDIVLGKVAYSALHGMEMTAVWAVDPALVAIGAYFFPQASVRSYTVALLEALQKTTTNQETCVCVHLRSSFLQIAVFERGNLLFFNTFNYEKPADVLYFTLLAYDQYFLKPSDTPLFISGELLKESEIYKQYERFIRHIQFLPAAILPGISEGILPHIYLDQTI